MHGLLHGYAEKVCDGAVDTWLDESVELGAGPGPDTEGSPKMAAKRATRQSSRTCEYRGRGNVAGNEKVGGVCCGHRSMSQMW